jgi:hypothetical protein
MLPEIGTAFSPRSPAIITYFSYCHIRIFFLGIASSCNSFYRGLSSNHLCYRTHPRDVSSVIGCDPTNILCMVSIPLALETIYGKRAREKYLPCVLQCARDRPKAN